MFLILFGLKKAGGRSHAHTHNTRFSWAKIMEKSFRGAGSLNSIIPQKPFKKIPTAIVSGPRPDFLFEKHPPIWILGLMFNGFNEIPTTTTTTTTTKTKTKTTKTTSKTPFNDSLITF